MSDEFTRAVCEAVQESHWRFGSYFECVLCNGTGVSSTEDIAHKEGCIVVVAWGYLNPATLPTVEGPTCGFNEAWVGACKNPIPCTKHSKQVCSTWGCTSPATHSCDDTSFLVCGAPHCDKHSCNHSR